MGEQVGKRATAAHLLACRGLDRAKQRPGLLGLWIVSKSPGIDAVVSELTRSERCKTAEKPIK